MTPHAWPVDRAGEAMHAVLGALGVRVELPWGAGAEELQRCGERMGVAAQRGSVPYAELHVRVRQEGPALWSLGDEVLAVAGPPDVWDRLPVLAPGGRLVRVPAEEVLELLLAPAVGDLQREVDALLDAAGVAPSRRPAARGALSALRLPAGEGVTRWRIRLAAHAPLSEQLRALRLVGPVVAAIVARLVATGSLVGSWAVLGGAVYRGEPGSSWGPLWMLLLLTGVWAVAFGAWLQGHAALRLATWTKHRILEGLLRLPPERLRADGVGGVLARAQGSGALEALALSGGLGPLFAMMDLFVASAVLAAVPGGRVLAWSLVVGLAVVVVASVGWARHLLRWVAAGRELTDGFVERVLGHRTRLGQGDPARWHEGEDEALTRYLGLGRRLDDASVGLGLLPVLWGSGALAWVGVQAVLSTWKAGWLAVALGGVILGRHALEGLSAAVGAWASAVVGWREVGELLRAGSEPPWVGTSTTAPAPARTRAPLLRAVQVSASWPSGPQVLHGVDFSLAAGDRVVLTGPSGGGKSTLVALLSGRLRPDRGLLLLDGADLATLGETRWARAVTSCPQFEDNLILQGSLLYNLVMGVAWPCPPALEARADALCRALGLGPLLDRMPGGLHQVVGAAGWQLSHGERSRVFLARALIRDSRLVLLDESFAALDAATMQRCLEVAEAHAETLVVVAHP